MLLQKPKFWSKFCALTFKCDNDPQPPHLISCLFEVLTFQPYSAVLIHPYANKIPRIASSREMINPTMPESELVFVLQIAPNMPKRDNDDMHVVGMCFSISLLLFSCTCFSISLLLLLLQHHALQVHPTQLVSSPNGNVNNYTSPSASNELVDHTGFVQARSENGFTRLTSGKSKKPSPSKLRRQQQQLPTLLPHKHPLTTRIFKCSW